LATVPKTARDAGVVVSTAKIGLMALAMDATDGLGWSGISLCRARQPQRGQRDTREAEAEFLERPAAGDGLGQALGQFIEFVVHNFPFILFVVLIVVPRLRA